MPTKGGVHVKWVGDRVVDKMGKKLSRNADVVGLFLQKKVRQKISTGQPVKRTAGGRTVGTTPAKPGAPPRLLMGGLRRSIDYDKKKKARDKVQTHVMRYPLRFLSILCSYPLIVQRD